VLYYSCTVLCSLVVKVTSSVVDLVVSARTPRPASGDSATFDSEQGSVEVTPKTPPTREQAVAGETSFANPAVVDKKGSARMRRPVHECEIREDDNSRTWKKNCRTSEH
jgi:hypothetical protein